MARKGRAASFTSTIFGRRSSLSGGGGGGNGIQVQPCCCSGGGGGTTSDCPNCDANTTHNRITATISGVSDDPFQDCSCCSGLNGTYVLGYSGATSCQWGGTFEPCGSGNGQWVLTVSMAGGTVTFVAQCGLVPLRTITWVVNTGSTNCNWTNLHVPFSAITGSPCAFDGSDAIVNAI